MQPQWKSIWCWWWWSIITDAPGYAVTADTVCNAKRECEGNRIDGNVNCDELASGSEPTSYPIYDTTHWSCIRSNHTSDATYDSTIHPKDTTMDPTFAATLDPASDLTNSPTSDPTSCRIQQMIIHNHCHKVKIILFLFVCFVCFVAISLFIIYS